MPATMESDSFIAVGERPEAGGNYIITRKADLRLSAGGRVHYVDFNRDGTVCICGQTMQLELAALLDIRAVIDAAIANKQKG